MMICLFHSFLYCDSLSGLIADVVAMGWIGHFYISPHNLHGDGVEHPDKTLLVGGIVRWHVLHMLEGMMLIASPALNLDLEGKFGQYT